MNQAVYIGSGSSRLGACPRQRSPIVAADGSDRHVCGAEQLCRTHDAASHPVSSPTPRGSEPMYIYQE